MENWLTDEAIEEFLVTPFLRVETTEIYQKQAGTAWVILDAEKRKFLGTVTRSGDGYYAFVPELPATKVASFSTAVTLIELASTSQWVERDHVRSVRDGVILPEES